MKTKDTATIAILPIGEFDTDLVKNDFDAIIGTLNRLKTNLIISDPVSDMIGARQSVKVLSEKAPHLLAIIVLRGLSAETIEAAVQISPAPCLVLPVQGRYALPSSALAVGAIRESKVWVELVYAPPEHPEFIRRIHHVVQAAKAYAQIKNSRIGIIGGLFSNLVSCRYDPQVLNSRLGLTLLPVSFDTIRRLVQTTEGRIHEVEKVHQELTSSFKVDAADWNALDAGIKLHLALKKVAREQKIDGFATECWSGFPRELGLNPCMGFIEDDYALACEGDVMLCISLLLVRYLTGSNAYTGDIFDLDLDGILTLVHCGAPASLASNKCMVALGKSQLALERGFETMTCRPRLDPGPVTIFRLYGSQCDKLHLAAGELINCETSPNLTVKVRIKGNRWEFLDQCYGNHYLVVAGDIRSELELLSNWLGVKIFET